MGKLTPATSRERAPSTSFCATLQGVAPNTSASTSTCERGMPQRHLERDARGRQRFFGRHVGQHVERGDVALAVGEHVQRALTQRLGERGVGNDEDAVHAARRVGRRLCGPTGEVEERSDATLMAAADLRRRWRPPPPTTADPGRWLDRAKRHPYGLCANHSRWAAARPPRSGGLRRSQRSARHDNGGLGDLRIGQLRPWARATRSASLGLRRVGGARMRHREGRRHPPRNRPPRPRPPPRRAARHGWHGPACTAAWRPGRRRRPAPRAS